MSPLNDHGSNEAVETLASAERGARRVFRSIALALRARIWINSLLYENDPNADACSSRRKQTNLRAARWPSTGPIQESGATAPGHWERYGGGTLRSTRWRKLVASLLGKRLTCSIVAGR
jgi:hypothetical protein